MASAGYSISGYDAHLQERVRVWLDKAGVVLDDFLFSESVGEYTTLVHSSAVSQEHPILVAAREAGLRVMRRGEMLAEVAKQKRLIAVVGSHGKTTTSGMIAHGLQHCGIEANYILGGLFSDSTKAPSHYCDSEWLLAEVDESDGTIDHFSPEVSLVLNIDWDHADRYSEAAHLEEAFAQLLARTKKTVLSPGNLKLSVDSGTQKKCFDGSSEKLNLEAPPLGRFNSSNGDAAAAVLSMLSNQLPVDVLSSFEGMARRQSTLYSSDELVVIEDYAHHPTEIDALLDCLKSTHPNRRITVVFQPHRYSRTRQFKSEFATSLEAAHEVLLLPVYAAFENHLEDADSAALAGAFSADRPEILETTLQGMDVLKERVSGQPTLLAFVGAGDIEEFAAAFSARWRNQNSLDAALLDYSLARVSPDCAVKQNVPLANKTTMRVGGPARLYAEPANLSDLRELMRAAELFGLPTFCIGRGSNLLVSDEGFDGLVIRFSAPAWRTVRNLSEGRIWTAAGGRLKEICGFAAKNGLAGFEFLEGIPGAVGGALRMNAGAMGSWMFDVVERVQFIDEYGKYQDLPKEAFRFGYRKVEEISRGIALGAILSSVDSESESSIRGRIDSYSSSRKESQPRGASAGCIFKNPEGNYAGKLIDQYGIKGMRVGAAEVSDVHGNFIVNHGGATAADVIELVKRIRAKVKAESGYILEPEVLLVGQSWDDVLSE
jgi:UDP-N-acetylenolpyruvoylglucosamine reductase